MLKYFLTNLILSSIIFAPVAHSPVNSLELVPPPELAQLPVAKTVEKNTGPQLIKPEVVGVQLPAKQAAVLDQGSGQFLYEKDSWRPVPLASLTKLMTALVWLEQKVDPGAVVEILPTDFREGGVPYLIPGEKFKVQDLLAASLIASANDATAALARSTGLSEAQFVELMNTKAKQLGLSKTKFVDPIGLDPANVSTAREAAILALAAFGRPEIKALASLSNYGLRPLNGVNSRQLKSTNQLLGSFINQGEFKIIGGKTGHLTEAGYNLVTALTNQAGKEIIVVVLGGEKLEDRFLAAKILAWSTFDSYQWP